MPTPAWDDLDDFIDADDFAVSVTITPQAGAVRHVLAIFDDPYLNADIGEYEADVSMPRLTCKASDVAGIKRGDAVTVPGESGTFLVMADPQRDGTGMAVLRLAHNAGP